MSSAGAGMGTGRQVSKCEKTCLCIAGRVQHGLDYPLRVPSAILEPSAFV